MSKHIIKLVKKIIIVFCIAFVGAFGLFSLLMQLIDWNRYSDYMQEENRSGEMEESPESETGDPHGDTVSDNKTDVKDEESSSEQFKQLVKEWGIQITPQEELDFHNTLSSDNYAFFNGIDISTRLDKCFSFAYPKKLFKDVLISADDTNGEYRVCFRGEKSDASLQYSQDRYSTEEGKESLIQSLYAVDIDTLSDVNTIFQSTSIYVIDGIENDNLEVYKVVKADENNIYKMIIKTPVPEKEEEQKMVAYYTEYLYRSCGFSGSSKKPRTYTEYLQNLE